MINRFIYTLYLFSRYRKLEDHFLISGGLTFLYLQLNVIAIAKILCLKFSVSFIEIFFQYRLLYVVVTVIVFFLSKFYAQLVINRGRRNYFKIHKLPLIYVWLFMLMSLLFFLTTMIAF